jgi:hypothetical protein
MNLATYGGASFYSATDHDPDWELFFTAKNVI